MSAEDEEPQREYLTVPFDDKNEVKSLGARWEPASKRWYIGPDCSDNNLEELERWKSPSYLVVPYEEKNDAKSAGAAWDANKKKWYVPPNSTPETRDSLMEQWGVWSPAAAQPTVQADDSPLGDGGITYLKVAYSDRNSVKAGGALWSSAKKKWYVPANAIQEVRDFLVSNWGETAEEPPPMMNDFDDDGFDPNDPNC